MIRYLFLNGFIAVWTIIMSAYGIVISMFDTTGRLVHFRCAVPWARMILRVCGIRVRVRGLENVDTDVPRIYMTNHQSFLDIFALLAFLPVDFKFILKQELMKLPVFGPAVRRAGYIGIERDDPRKAVKSMNLAAERIKNGASVLIFPEGTRSPDGTLGSFKKGGFSLAVKSGCDIVPVAIDGSCRIAPKGSLRIKKGSFSLSVGRPISLEGSTKKDIPGLMERVRKAMLRQMEEGRSFGSAAGGSSLKRSLGMILFLTLLMLGGQGNSSGYVMPADQLIDKMRANFSRLKTLVIDQSTHILDPERQEAPVIFEERVWLKSPGFCRSEIAGDPETLGTARPKGSSEGSAGRELQDVPPRSEVRLNRDTAFRRLLMSSDRETLMGFLVRVGVNLQSVGLTRVDGVVAYWIGDKGPESPRLLINKDNFLPLLFAYVPLPATGRGLAVVKYGTYRRVDSGWYPYEIDYLLDKTRSERYLALSISVNVPVKESFFKEPEEGGRALEKPAGEGEEEERLKEVIRLLKEKYGD